MVQHSYRRGLLLIIYPGYMNKRKLFIMTHLCSKWETLAESLMSHERYHVFNTGNSYHHPDDVNGLTSMLHRKDNAAAIWVDVIFHNKDFTMKRLCKYYHFIFWSCPLDQCLDDLIKLGYSERRAADYWHYRMSGLKTYYHRAGGLWVPALE